MRERPTGTITFLFTDVEGSTQLWEQHHAWMETAHHRHEAILREAIAAHGGWAYKQIGDAFQAAFQTAPQAVAAAVAAQRSLLTEPWGGAGPIKVRMALHTGSTEERADDYVGPLLNRVARLLGAGHGGQILLTATTAELVGEQGPGGVALRDLGERRLKDLIRPEHVFQVVATDLPAAFPPLKTLDYRPNNLPRQTTALFGRAYDIAPLLGLLRAPPTALVTLTGPGGTGKTRLALQVAADLLDDFADGVWFVDLAPIQDPTLVVATIAQTLGVPEAGGTPLIQTLQTHLRGKQRLVLLDNFEQVVAAAPDVAALLAGCPQLKVLVTSRVPLRLRGEREYPVPPLPLPDIRPGHLPAVDQLAQYDAVRLFVERATAVKGDFALTNANAPAVAEICVRLDGLPLANELAAARIRLLSPQALLARLQNRLKLLTGGGRDRPARQQTLESAIAWSYDLLDVGEQMLFRRMAVFHGGTLEALEAVATAPGDLPIAVLDGVESLVSKSLLHQEEDAAGEARFVMLETIHEFARQKLEASGEAEAARAAHAQYFAGWAARAGSWFERPDATAWLQRFDNELGNLRATLSWAMDADLEIGLQTAAILRDYWFSRGYLSEPRAWYDLVLAKAQQIPLAPAAYAQALFTAGMLDFHRSTNRSGEPLFAHSSALFRQLGDQRATAKALRMLAQAGRYQNRDKAVERGLYTESLALYRAAGDEVGAAEALRTLGRVALDEENPTLARALYEESLALAQHLNSKPLIGWALSGIGEAAHLAGDYTAASRLAEQAVAIFEELQIKPMIADCRIKLAYALEQQGFLNRARAEAARALRLYQEAGVADGISAGLALLGGMAARGDQPLLAARLLAWAHQLATTVGLAWDPRDLSAYRRYIALAQAQLDPARWQQVWDEGSMLSVEQAVAYALSEVPDEQPAEGGSIMSVEQVAAHTAVPREA